MYKTTTIAPNTHVHIFNNIEPFHHLAIRVRSTKELLLIVTDDAGADAFYANENAQVYSHKHISSTSELFEAVEFPFSLRGSWHIMIINQGKESAVIDYLVTYEKLK